MDSNITSKDLDQIFQQAVAACSSGNVKQGVSIYAQLIVKHNHYPSFVNLAVVHRDAGHTDLARNVVLKGISLFPKGHHLWHILAKLEFVSLDYAPAISLLNNSTKALKHPIILL